MIYKIKVVNNVEDILVIQRVAEMERDRYQKSGDYSVTDLINPVRVVHLKKRHGHDVVPNLKSLTGSFMGTAMHDFVEKYLRMWIDKHDYREYHLEQQVFLEWEGEEGKRLISGRYDIREDKELSDLKTAKVWKLIFDPNLEEYHEQQNLYSYLLHKSEGIDLEHLYIIAMYKDWTEGSALRDPRNYPQSDMVQYELTQWDRKVQKQLFNSRVQALVNTEGMDDNELPVCSRDERWERHQGGETIHYAILKNRLAKRATKVIRGGDLGEAMSVANGMKGITTDSVIEVRYALPKRCVGYCEVNGYCNWYQNWLKKNEEGKVNDYFKIKG